MAAPPEDQTLPVAWVCADKSTLRHDTGPDHPERPERLVAIEKRLRDTGLEAELLAATAPALDPGDLELVHPTRFVRHVQERIQAGAPFVDQPDANVAEGSFQAALGAAGAACHAVDQVLTDQWGRAFVSARPPGHHAEESMAMGFCLFNNVALAARRAQRHHGLSRVLVVDWDVHHGNGTQHIFEQDPSVMYISLHQYPHYPGTGDRNERGVGEGEGATLNLPQAAGSRDADWLSDFESVALPAAEAFQPELLLISAGFDAHHLDPLSQTHLGEESYRTMTEGLVQACRSSSGGRVVSLLEGGYSLEGLALSVEQHIRGLLVP